MTWNVEGIRYPLFRMEALNPIHIAVQADIHSHNTETANNSAAAVPHILELVPPFDPVYPDIGNTPLDQSTSWPLRQ